MLRAVLLDLYNGEDNRGIPMLRSLLDQHADDFTYDHLDVRVRNEVPGLEYDIYIFSGGPGDPLECLAAQKNTCFLSAILSRSPVMFLDWVR
jgi:carbamoylphosphate synthase small subunit